MWIAILDTANFNFLAFGNTRVDALAAMQEGWTRHAREMGAAWTWDYLRDDINVYEAVAGECLRDGCPFTMTNA